MMMMQIFAAYSKNHTERVRASCGMVAVFFIWLLRNYFYAQVKMLC